MSDVTDEMRATAHHAFRQSALQQAGRQGEWAAFDKWAAINAALAAVAPLIAAAEREACLQAFRDHGWDTPVDPACADTVSRIAAAIRARGTP